MGLLRRAADRLGVYDRIRYSRPYEWLLRVRNPGYLARLAADRELYRRVLGGRVRLVFDVGANTGDKAWAFRQLADRVVCVEPDPAAAATLRTRFRRHPGVAVEEAAVGAAEQTAVLYVQTDGSAYNSLSPKHRALHHGPAAGERRVAVTTLDRLIATHGRPDFLKVDVEGYEREVFAGLSAPVPIVSFEANLPAFRDETHAVLDALLRLDPATRFNALPAGGHAFLFADPTDAGPVRRLVDDPAPRSYDLFAFSAR